MNKQKQAYEQAKHELDVLEIRCTSEEAALENANARTPCLWTMKVKSIDS